MLTAIPVVDVAALLTPPPDFRFPVALVVVIVADDAIISIELPMVSSPKSECNDEGGDVDDAGGG